MATAPEPTAAKPRATTTPRAPTTPAMEGGDEGLEKLDPRVALRRQFHEALRSRMHDNIDKDGSYFSYMFLDKLLNSTKRCYLCGAKESGKLPDSDISLELYVAETGVVGQQKLECTKCKRLYMVTSCDDASEVPSDPKLSIRGMEIRYYCKRITHFEVLHDLMELLHIAATDDDKLRREKHAEVADFMLRNARRVCEEWCKAEYVELRLKKYLRLREETLLSTYNPTFTPECTDEYKEMYGMMADSFRQNRRKVLLLLELMKESLVDNPTRPSFMMWVSIAMMHSENYHKFKATYDPRSFMRVDSTEYQALKDRYLALDVPLGVKKIPVVFMLFEVPRFHHFVDFLSRRLGKRRPRTFLTDDDKAKLVIATEESKRLGIKRKPKSGKLVSPEAHLDFLTHQDEIEREMLFQSCRDKEKKKEKAKAKSKRRNASQTPTPPANPPEPRYSAVIPREQGPRPVCMSKDDFKSMLYDHLKANEASVASGRIPGLPSNFPPIPPAATQPAPAYVKYSTLELPLPPIPPPRVRPPPDPQDESVSTDSASGKKVKKIDKKTTFGDFEDPTKTVLVAQIDSEILRAQGYTISEEGRLSSVVASRNNIIEFILEGFPNPDEVKAYLSMKYQAMQKDIEEESAARAAAIALKDNPSSSSDSDVSSDASTGSVSGKKKRARRKRKKKVETGDGDGDGGEAKDDDVTPSSVGSSGSSQPSRTADKATSVVRPQEEVHGVILSHGVAPNVGNTASHTGTADSDTTLLEGCFGAGMVHRNMEEHPEKEILFPATNPSPEPQGKPHARKSDLLPITKPSSPSCEGVGVGEGDGSSTIGVVLGKKGEPLKTAEGDTTPKQGGQVNFVETPKEQGGDSEDEAAGKIDGDAAKSKKTARDKFKTCENCQLVINERIQVCAGCKKVAYCNYRCQKAHWKVHKKCCSYALKKDTKDRTG